MAPRPELCVGAVARRADDLLLIRRGTPPGLGQWSLPGGRVEPGETMAEAVVREVAEETGWKVEVGRLIGVYSDPESNVVDYSFKKSGQRKGAGPDGGDRRVQIVNLCFHAEAVEAGEMTTPDETLEMGFFAADALPQPFVPIHAIRIEDGLAKRAEAAVR